jgi:hypothetical protein
MDLPNTLKLPSDKRGMVRAVGNAVAGGVAKAILNAAKEVAYNSAHNFTACADNQSVFKKALECAETCVAWYHKREQVKQHTKRRMPPGLSSVAEKRVRDAVVEAVMNRTQ